MDKPQYPPPTHQDAGPYYGPPQGNQGYYGGGPPPQGNQGYYGPPQGMQYGGPPQQYGQPQQPMYVQDSRAGRSGGGGCCAGIAAALACCCCLDCLF